MFTHFIEDIKKSLTYIFEYPNWYLRLWIFPAIAIVPVIGLIGIILLKGWRFKMTQHLAASSAELPKIDLFQFFKTGFVLWIFTFLYLFVPAIFLFATGLGGPISLIMDTGVILNQGINPWAAAVTQNIVVTIIVYLIWLVMSLPAYQAGMIRYAMSDSWTSMLNVPANVLLVLRNPIHFTKFYVSWTILSMMVILISATLISSIAGIILVPTVITCVYYITTAHELGALAERLNSQGTT